MWEWRDELLHSRGHEDRQCSPSCVQLPDSPLTSFSVLPCDWKARSPTAPKTEELLLKIHKRYVLSLARGGYSSAHAGRQGSELEGSSSLRVSSSPIAPFLPWPPLERPGGPHDDHHLPQPATGPRSFFPGDTEHLLHITLHPAWLLQGGALATGPVRKQSWYFLDIFSNRLFSKGQIVPPGLILWTEEAGLSRRMVQGKSTSRNFVLLNALPPGEESFFLNPPPPLQV